MLRKEKLLSIINEHKQIIAHLKKNESYEIDTIIHEHLRSDIKSHYMQKILVNT